MMTKQPLLSKMIWLILFSIAFGLLESVVVVYLRELYYPEGFNFPLANIPPNVYLTEIGREVATLLMLASMGILAGRTAYEKFAFFLISFGVWDIFYYVFLKMILGWPASFLTWDILFLIPIAWLGPVLAPMLCALSMISLGIGILYLSSKDIRFSKLEWSLLSAGSILILYSFMWDYGKLMWEGGYFRDFLNLLENEVFIAELGAYVPSRFNWGVFGVGYACIVGASGIYLRKSMGKSRSERK